MHSKKKEWLNLTGEVLGRNRSEIVRQAESEALDLLMEKMMMVLEAITTPHFTLDIRKGLRKALLPFMQTLQLLHYQEADYCLKREPAVLDGERRRFQAEFMEDIEYGDAQEGLIKASIFPALYKVGCAGENGSVSFTRLRTDETDILT